MKKWSDYKWVQLGVGKTEDVLKTLSENPKGSVIATWDGLSIKSDMDLDAYTFDAVASDDSLDRWHEVIRQDGWNLKDYHKNPVILWGHQHDLPAIGRSLETKVEDGKLIIRPQLAVEEYPLAATIWRLVKSRFIRAISVGFMVEEWETESEDYPDAELVFTKQSLLENSIVNVPCNPNALIDDVKSLQADIYVMQALGILSMAVPKFDEGKKLDEDVEWDGDKAESSLKTWAGGPDKDKMDWAKYARGFGWYDSEEKESFGSYKLPHHIIEEGDFCTPWSGVSAAMGALLGARGGVKIPDDERETVYNHLVKHYKQYDKEPPEFKAISEIDYKEVLARLDEIKTLLR